MFPLRKQRALVLASLTFVLASGVAVLRAQTVTPIEPRAAWERWFDDVPHSGGVLVGVMSSAGAARLEPSRVMFARVLGTSMKACLEVNSSDGRYTSRMEYDVPSGAPGSAVALHVPTKHAEKLRRYRAGELAILIRIDAKRCNDGAGEVVASSWPGATASDSVVVLLNSRLPTDIIGGSGRAIEHVARCTDLRGSKTSVNLRCPIPRDWIRAGVSFFVRMREERTYSYIDLPLQVR